MNLLSWLNGWKEDSNNDYQLGFSFLFPATIGVGSIVIFLAVRYRNDLINLKSSMFKNPKDESASSRRGNSYPTFKKKPKYSTKSEPNNSQTKKTEVSRTVVVETQAPVLPVQQTKYTSVQPVQIKQEVVSEATDGIEAEFFSPVPKKHKKSKRSSKTKDTQNHGSDEKIEVDPAWVTVTSKKVKLSNRNGQKKVKNTDSEGDQSVPENHSLPISFNEPSIQNKQRSNKQLELSVSNKSSSSVLENKPTNLVVNTNESCSSNQSKDLAEAHLIKTEYNENVKSVSANSPPYTSYEELLYKNLGAETVTAIRSLILNSEPHLSRATEIPLSSGELSKQKASSTSSKDPNHLPTTREIVSQHTTAQLQAREAECQILRTEVVHLRDEVKMLKTLALNSVPIQKPMVDAETITDPIEFPDNKSSLTQHQNDSDTILLSTLQNEIARLVKEVVIYQQRSENLRSRLDTANKKLSDSKSKSADETKLLQQTLDTQSEKLYNLESEKGRLEKELNDILQKAEVHRRKSEVLENGNSILREEKDTLSRTCDELSNKHSAVLSELTASQSQCNALRRQIAEYEERLHQLNDQHQIVVDGMKNQLKSLLCNHETNEKSHINMINTLEAKLEQLTNETNEQRNVLKLYEGELEHLRAENAKLVEKATSSNEDKFVHTVDEVQRSSTNHENIVGTHDYSDQTDSNQFIIQSNEYNLLQTQVDHYKSALDATESMLSKLQTSVNEEEARWHKALDAANIENELLKTKSVKLEAALNELIQDRNTLTTTIEELRKNNHLNNNNSVETHTENSLSASFNAENKMNKSSSISPSPSSPLSTTATTTDTDEQNMSKSELIHLISKLRYLVEVERNALKQEQSLSAELRTKLNDADARDNNNIHNHSNNCSSESMSLNNNHTKTIENNINHNSNTDHYTSFKSSYMHNHQKGGLLETDDDDNSNILKSEHLDTSFDGISKFPDCIPQHEISSNDGCYVLVSNGIHKELNGKTNHEPIDNDNSDD
ncbi:hypothetical protein EWB00_008038 [Schistosoma japonicum]|uniref:Uncharacterized protein n=2 Tax=Schistosoma japonicum TaxID=6182 RepID=A0A4Z2CS92_SCHJA|nr:hypothetical protein EWB00_008038 [Schistosoma japonicum]